MVQRVAPCLSILSSASDEMYTCSDVSTMGVSEVAAPPPPTTFLGLN